MPDISQHGTIQMSPNPMTGLLLISVIKRDNSSTWSLNICYSIPLKVLRLNQAYLRIWPIGLPIHSNFCRTANYSSLGRGAGIGLAGALYESWRDSCYVPPPVMPE